MEKQSINKSKIVKFVRGGDFSLLLLFQIGMIFYFNFSDIRNSLDSDFANTIYHFQEVIKNGTLNLENWNHTTSMELDATFLFAVPVYYLIHNIYTAVGIANMIYVVLYIVTICGIFRGLQVKKRYLFFTLCLVLTPYSFGMLEYFNMMFYGGACYSLKTLVPLLFIWLFMLFEKQGERKREKGLKAIVLLLYFFLLFVTSFSTGFYVMLCGILPLFGCMILDILKTGAWSGRYRRSQIGLAAGSVIVFVTGYLLHQKFYGLISRNGMMLTKIENYAVNFRACVRGIFDVFGATFSEDIRALSPEGLWYCLKMGFVVLLLIVLGVRMFRLFQKRQRPDVRDFLTVLPLFNFLVLLIADSRYSANTHIEYRYYLIGAVPLLLLLGIQLDEWEEKWNGFQKNILLLLSGTALALLMAGNNVEVIRRWDRTSYAVELCNYFNTLDVESVFFVNDPDTAHICKGIDANHKFGTFLSDTQSLELSICSYYESEYGSFYGGKNALAVFIYTVPEDYMPEEIASHYRKVGTVRWFEIYVGDEVLFP